MNLLLFLLASLFCNFIFSLVFISFFNEIRHKYYSKQVVLVDLENILDTKALEERAHIWANSRKKQDEYSYHDEYNKYFLEHINEISLNITKIKKVLEYQFIGYTLCFIYNRPEFLRAYIAKILNQWGLHGQLYMTECDYIRTTLFYDKMLKEILIKNIKKEKNVVKYL